MTDTAKLNTMSVVDYWRQRCRTAEAILDQETRLRIAARHEAEQLRDRYEMMEVRGAAPVFSWERPDGSKVDTSGMIPPPNVYVTEWPTATDAPVTRAEFAALRDLALALAEPASGQTVRYLASKLKEAR